MFLSSFQNTATRSIVTDEIPSLADLARHLLTHGPRKVLPTTRRVRVIHNHTFIVDTVKAVQVWEHDYYPQYYVPLSELKNCTWKDKHVVEAGKGNGDEAATAVVEVTVSAQNGIAEAKTDRVIRFADTPSLEKLAGLVRLEFGSMGSFASMQCNAMSCFQDSSLTLYPWVPDQWLEEDSPIYVHPKDPFKRIDTLPSSRTVEVRVAGRTIAKTSSSIHLFETGLPPRYYLPWGAVDQSVLRKSELITKCPYKGEAEYFHIELGDSELRDVVWYYRLPTHESAAITGLLCFYNEKVEILLDGELQEKPKTVFT
ncbi:hypothetical protein G7046_g1249 [Stylonectria norvegica]|nr:hypothetical protein G7046_g1249 [Stylonectria norvegica]